MQEEKTMSNDNNMFYFWKDHGLWMVGKVNPGKMPAVLSEHKTKPEARREAERLNGQKFGQEGSK